VATLSASHAASMTAALLLPASGMYADASRMGRALRPLGPWTLIHSASWSSALLVGRRVTCCAMAVWTRNATPRLGLLIHLKGQVAGALPGLLHCDDVNLGGCRQVNQLVHLLIGEPLRVPAHACQRGVRAGGAPVLALPPGAAAGAWLVWHRCLVSALPHWLHCVCVSKKKLSTTSELAVGRGRGRVRRAAAAPWATTGGWASQWAAVPGPVPLPVCEHGCSAHRAQSTEKGVWVH
jgi:hypothetical protein